MKIKQSALILASTLTLSCAFPALAAVDGLSANVSATSNYLFRGITQTQDGAAVQGGVDYAHETGFYVGTWASNVDFDPSLLSPNVNVDFATSYEIDVYAGFSGSAGEVGYDVGFIYYAYPDASRSSSSITTNGVVINETKNDLDVDLYEVYGSLSYKNFTVGAYYLLGSDDDAFSQGMDDDWLYLYGDASFEVSEGLSLGLHVGHTSGDSIEDWLGDEYLDYNVSLSKDGFSIMLSDTDLNLDDPKLVVSYSMSFDL